MHAVRHRIPMNVVNNVNIRNVSSDYCLDLIKKYDYENFLCTLLLKNEARTSAVAIRAFNVEISRIQDQTSDPKIGLMRMQFWDDAIDKCFAQSNKIPNHPVIFELNRILRRSKFTKRYFKNLIRCRRELITSNTFTTLDEMEKYAEHSVSNLYYLILEGSGVRNVHADHAVSHLGKAQGIVQLLRTIPVTRHTSFVSLPRELMIQHNVSQEDLIRGRNSDRVTECVFEVATRANQHLEKARNLSESVPREARSVLLAACIIDRYLQRLLSVQCNIFHQNLQARNLFWIPLVWWNNFRNKY